MHTSRMVFFIFFSSETALFPFTCEIPSATGGSGDGGGDRHSSRGKGKRIVGSHDKPKKMSTREKAMFRYLQRCHEYAVTADQEPPFGGRHAPPPVPDVSDPLSTTVAGGTNKPQDETRSSKHSSSPSKDG
uniref:Uncharacterized protein n=1 Tax=Setaria viridis TaxID=4556 RepID=A0A4U6T2Z0_SETVI|nr:hypothetical protein SEVIR_9G319733v2 [Setaria viridis]